MQFGIRLTVNEDDFKACIAAAWQKAYDVSLQPDDIKDFAIGDVVSATDVTNILIGSCLAELNIENQISMQRIA